MPTVDVDPADVVARRVHRGVRRSAERGDAVAHRVHRAGPRDGHFTGATGDDVYLNSGPLFHLGTLMHTLATFVFGGTNVFLRRVDAEELCRVIEAERCTGAFLVGPIIEQILEVNSDGRYDLSTLRTASVGTTWDAMTSRDRAPWAPRPAGTARPRPWA